jgi:hypothetical protein
MMGLCVPCRRKIEQKKLAEDEVEAQVAMFNLDLEEYLIRLVRFDAYCQEIGWRWEPSSSRRWRRLPEFLRERSTQRPLYWVDE